MIGVYVLYCIAVRFEILYYVHALLILEALIVDLRGFIMARVVVGPVVHEVYHLIHAAYPVKKLDFLPAYVLSRVSAQLVIAIVECIMRCQTVITLPCIYLINAFKIPDAIIICFAPHRRKV